MELYDVVRVVAVRNDRFKDEKIWHQRHPLVGDVGTVLEDYGSAFEVECSEPGTGKTIWLNAMYTDELEKV